MMKFIVALTMVLLTSANIAHAQREIRCDTPTMERLGLLETSVSYWSVEDFACWELVDSPAVFTAAEAESDEYYQLRREARLENSEWAWVVDVQDVISDSTPIRHDGVVWHALSYYWDVEGEESYCFEAVAESGYDKKRQYIDFCDYGRTSMFNGAAMLRRLPSNPF